jgi:hypothetical protein
MVTLTLNTLLEQAEKKKAQLTEQIQIVDHNEVLEEFAKLKAYCKDTRIVFNIELPSFSAPKFAKQNKKNAAQLWGFFTDLISGNNKQFASEFFENYPALSAYMLNADERAIASALEVCYSDPKKHSFIFLLLDNLRLHRKSIVPKLVGNLLELIKDTKNHDLFTQLMGNDAFREAIGTHKKLREQATALDVELLTLKAEQAVTLGLYFTNKIFPKDFFNYDDRLKRSPNFIWAHYTEVCQRITNYVCLHILGAKDKYVRNYIISMWVLLAYKQKALGDLSLSFFIMQALNTKEVRRLIISEEVEVLPKSIIKMFNDLSTFYDSTQNYKLLRAEVQERIDAGDIFVPPLPIISKDARFAIDGNAPNKVAKNGVLIGILSSLGSQTSYSQHGKLEGETAEFVAAADPAQHPFTQIESEREYFQGFLNNIYQDVGVQGQFSLNTLWRQMRELVGVIPQESVTKLGFPAFSGHEKIDGVFEEYKYKLSEKMLSREDKKDKSQVATKIKNDRFLDKYIDSLAEIIVAKIPVLAKVNPEIKEKRQQMFAYGTKLTYQHVLLNLGLTPGFDAEQFEKLKKGNPYATAFYNEDKAEYINNFISPYFTNWLKFVDLQANYETDAQGNITPATHPPLGEDLERYLDHFQLTPEQRKSVRWFLVQNPEYLPTAEQKAKTPVAFKADLLEKIEILGFKQHTALFAVLMNIVPIFAKNLEGLLQAFSTEQVANAMQPESASGATRTTEKKSSVKNVAKFLPERLTPQMSPSHDASDLQNNIIKNLDSIGKLPLFMFAQRLAMQLGADTSESQTINISEWGLDVSGAAGGKTRLQKVSRSYLIALLFDYINMFNNAVSRLHAAPNNLGQSTFLANLSDEQHALTRTQRVIKNILSKLDPNISLYLLLQPTFKEQMEIFHHNASDNTVVYGHNLSVFETAFYLSTKAFREIVFPARIIYLANSKEGSEELIDLSHCTNLKQVLMHLTEEHYQKRPYSNQEQLQIMHTVLQLAYSKLTALIKRQGVYEPTLQHVNIIHSVEGSPKSSVFMILQHWHSLFQMNSQLPAQERIDMSSFTNLFNPEKIHLLAQPTLTIESLLMALNPENQRLLSSNISNANRSCSADVGTIMRDSTDYFAPTLKA